MRSPCHLSVLIFLDLVNCQHLTLLISPCSHILPLPSKTTHLGFAISVVPPLQSPLLVSPLLPNLAIWRVRLWSPLELTSSMISSNLNPCFYYYSQSQYILNTVGPVTLKIQVKACSNIPVTPKRSTTPYVICLPSQLSL